MIRGFVYTNMGEEMMSSLAMTDALHGYEDNEIKSPGWNHTIYAEYSKKGGATVVMARKTLSPGFTPPQEKVLKECLMAFEAFPRNTTGLTFANFSIKAFESPPGHGGISVIGAQRVIGKEDHSGRGGPIWKHAVYTSAGPTHPAPVAIDERVLSEVGQELLARLGELEPSRGLRLASDFGRFQSADSSSKEREVLIQYLQRFDRLPQTAAPARLPYRFLVRRSEDSQRGVLYVRWQEPQHSVGAVVRSAARLATILYYSNFPWLAVELQSEDRQRDSGSLPGWVVRFVQTEGELQNRSARVVDYGELFPSGDAGESLTGLAARFFACLDCELLGARDAVSEPPSASPLSAQGARLTGEKGPLTLPAMSAGAYAKSTQTDRLGPPGSARAGMLADQPTEHLSAHAGPDAALALRTAMTTQALPVSGGERVGESGDGLFALTEIGLDAAPRLASLAAPPDVEVRSLPGALPLTSMLSSNPVPQPLSGGAAEPPAGLLGLAGADGLSGWRTARRLGLGLWGAVVFCGSLTSLLQTMQCGALGPGASVASSARGHQAQACEAGSAAAPLRSAATLPGSLGGSAGGGSGGSGSSQVAGSGAGRADGLGRFDIVVPKVKPEAGHRSPAKKSAGDKAPLPSSGGGGLGSGPTMAAVGPAGAAAPGAEPGRAPSAGSPVDGVATGSEDEVVASGRKQ